MEFTLSPSDARALTVEFQKIKAQWMSQPLSARDWLMLSLKQLRKQYAGRFLHIVDSECLMRLKLKPSQKRVKTR